jgi:hypothetical protein
MHGEVHLAHLLSSLHEVVIVVGVVKHSLSSPTARNTSQAGVRPVDHADFANARERDIEDGLVRSPLCNVFGNLHRSAHAWPL